MELNEMQQYVFTTTIFLDEEKKEFVKMREPNTQEMRLIQTGNGGEDFKKNIETMESLFKPCLVEHSFTENGEPAGKEKVYNELKKSGSLFLDIITEWFTCLPFSQRLKKKKSDN